MAAESDDRIRTLLEAGDVRGAATAALQAHGPEVLGYLRAMLRNEDAAAEAFSAFAEDLWQGLPGFRFESSLRTWAFRLAWNAALHWKDQAWNRKVRPFVTGEASAIALELRTATAVRVHRQRQVLDQLREGLSPDEISLLVLRVDKGLSWQETAGIMSAEGTPVDPVALAKRFERLKAKLATRARELGLVD